jgi:hypothetical protein
VKNRIALILFLAAWAASWWVLLATRSAPLHGAPPDAARFLSGELIGFGLVGVLWLLTRGLPGGAELARPGVRRAGAEALALIAYLLVLVGVGQALGLRTHLASVGLHAATHEVYHAHTAGSVVAWCAYYGVFGALLPLAYFRFGRGVSWRAMLLGFPRPSRLVPFALITAAMGIAAFAGRDYLELSIVGHLVAALVFTAGTFLPVMVLTQCLIVPRLALATGSTATAAVLGGLVYGLYHAGEFFMTWTTADAALLSACWTFQFAFFGFLKALTTLRSGSAWVHIFSTHAPHLAESPAVATVFGIR